MNTHKIAVLLRPAEIGRAQRRSVIAWSAAFRFSRDDHHVEHALEVSAASRLIRLTAYEQRRARRRRGFGLADRTIRQGGPSGPSQYPSPWPHFRLLFPRILSAGSHRPPRPPPPHT